MFRGQIMSSGVDTLPLRCSICVSGVGETSRRGLGVSIWSLREKSGPEEGRRVI